MEWPSVRLSFCIKKLVSYRSLYYVVTDKLAVSVNSYQFGEEGTPELPVPSVPTISVGTASCPMMTSQLCHFGGRRVSFLGTEAPVIT